MAAASDNFNRTDSTGLGADWTAVTNNFNVVSNRARKQGGTDSPGLVVYTATEPDTPDQRVECTIFTDLQVAYAGPAARASSAQHTSYELFANATESYLIRYNNGADTQLGNTGAGFANGTRLRLEVEGDNPVILRVYADEGSGFQPITSIATDGTVTDSSGSRITSANFFGLCGFGAGSANADADDWSAEDVFVGQEAGGTGNFAVGLLVSQTGIGQVANRKLLLTQAEQQELRDENGAPVANLTGGVYEWYDKTTDTEGDPVVVGTFDTNSNGEAIVPLFGTSLAATDEGILILTHPSDSAVRGVYRLAVN